MAANPATHDTLRRSGYAVGNPPTSEEYWLGVAWRALVAEIPSIPARMDGGTLDGELVADIVASAALRVLRNPEGLERFDTRLDDYSEGATIADASSDMYFTAAELRRLALPEYGAGSMSFH